MNAAGVNNDRTTDAGTNLIRRVWPRAREALFRVVSVRLTSRLLLPLLLFILSSFHADAATLIYSTYLGGGQYDGAFAATVDSSGNAYIAGGTMSTDDFPTLNPLQPRKASAEYSDCFVAKFDPDGRLLFSTYFGGIGYELPNAIALDPNGDIVIAGETHSVDLPTTDDAFQPDYNGGSAFGYGDGFIAKLAADGSGILYCSYFGTPQDERISGIAFDSHGNLCLTGLTSSKNLPLINAVQRIYGGGESDGFLAKLDPSLTHLLFSTYLGGEDRDEDQKIAIDASDSIYLSGSTLSTNFPITPGAFQTAHALEDSTGANWDGFVAKFESDGSRLVYSTYIGGPLDDGAYDIAVDAEGNACVTGEIRAHFDNVNYGFQSSPGIPGGDAYVAKLRPDGSGFLWFSYLGGAGDDRGYGIALDAQNNILLTGMTTSLDFPVVDAPQTKFAHGAQDAFVAKVSANGQKLLYSTYLGGGDEESGFAVTADRGGNAIVVGQTASLNFPILNAFQGTNASPPSAQDSTDAYLLKLSPAIQGPPLKIARSGRNVLVTWPTTFSDFALEYSDTLTGAIVWKKFPGSVFILGGQNTIIEGTANPARFYRLSRP